MASTSRTRIVDTALVDICRGRPPTLPDGPGVVEEFTEAARHHRIAPLAHVALRDAHPAAAAELKPDRDEALSRHLRVSIILGGVARTLEGMDWLTFKGPMLSEFAHPIPGLRHYKDIDLLVSPTDFREACERLFDQGWQLLFGDASLSAVEFPGEVPLVDRNGIVIDLHWSMVVMHSVRRRFGGDADALLARRVPATIGPAKLSALSPADAVVHVCQHAALIGATRLGHVLDADQLARAVTDWDDVVDRARAWGAGTQVAAVLGRAHRILGTPLPEGLDRRLGLGATMSAVLARVDRHLPIQRLRQDASWVRMVTRGLRPGPLGTAGAVVQRAATGVWHRLRPDPPEPPRMPATKAVLDAYFDRVTAVGHASASA